MNILSLPRHRAKHGRDETALLAAAVHPPQRRDIPPRAAVGSALPDPATKPIGFDDLRHQPDPQWSAAADRAQAYRDAEDAYRELSPWAPLHAAVAKERAVYALTGYVLTDIEVALARLAIAVSDLAVRPGGVHALRMALAPVQQLLAEVNAR